MIPKSGHRFSEKIMRPGKLSIDRLTYRYWLEREEREFLAFTDVSIDVADGEFVCIVGPSGCGKTTLLNILTGLLTYQEGEVRVDGARVNAPDVSRATVFQQASLLPWRTVTGNVRYGMEMQRRFREAEMRERADHFIKLAGLAGFEKRYPAELSGGMQQRVNLARALATDPQVLLMDEPFAALDAQTRELMQAELLKIWSSAGKTVVFVTHQIDEAAYLSDRVIVMGTRPGCIKAAFDVPFPRPRHLSLKREPQFLALTDRIWALIEEEAARINVISANPA
jgi:ABC-type nitrate/sulfonate/bicarbonate transport system ATPase subunit